MPTIEQYIGFFRWKAKYGQFNEAAHKRDEAGKFSTNGGGGKKSEPQSKAKKPAKATPKPAGKNTDVKVPKQRKPRGPKLPKDRSKMTIDLARRALEAKGYKQGKGRTNPINGKWTTEYEITAPDGTKKWMHVDDVRDIIYGTVKDQPRPTWDGSKPKEFPPLPTPRYPAGPQPVKPTAMPQGAVPPVQATVMPRGAVPPVQVPKK